MTSPPPMPLRGEPGAPSFNPLQLHDLKLYFCDLEYLFMHSGIKYSAQQKFYATYFVNPVTWELWESLPQYADPSSHFDTFKIAIYTSIMRSTTYNAIGWPISKRSSRSSHAA